MSTLPGPQTRNRPHAHSYARPIPRALQKQRRHHKRADAQELDEHVDRRTGSVLERIAHRVAHYRGFVRVGGIKSPRFFVAGCLRPKLFGPLRGRVRKNHVEPFDACAHCSGLS